MLRVIVAVVLVACFGGIRTSPLNVKQFSMDLEPVFQKGGARLKTYNYQNCGSSSDLANLTELVFSPDPLSFPGPLGVEFSVDVKADVGSGLSGDVLMTKRVGSKWLKIPCVGMIGSCHYADVCSLLAEITECPKQFVDAGIPCHCPIAKKAYTLPKASFYVMTPLFPVGDINVIANLHYQSHRVACANITATFT